MMLIERIKADQLKARKAKDTMTTKALTTIIGDSTEVGINAGQTSDDKVIAVIRKHLKGISESLKVVGTDNNELVPHRSILESEKALLESYLPKSLSADEIRDIVTQNTDANTDITKSIGMLMGKIKQAAAVQNKLFDGAQAQRILKDWYK